MKKKEAKKSQYFSPITGYKKSSSYRKGLTGQKLKEFIIKMPSLKIFSIPSSFDLH